MKPPHNAAEVAVLIVDTLRAAGIETGDGAPPFDNPWTGTPGKSTFRRYCFVTQLDNPTDGPLNDQHAILYGRYQITCVGATAQGARNYGEQVMQTLAGQTLTGDKWKTWRPIIVEEYGRVNRDETVQPAVYMVPHRFHVDTTRNLDSP